MGNRQEMGRAAGRQRLDHGLTGGRPQNGDDLGMVNMAAGVYHFVFFLVIANRNLDSKKKNIHM